MILPSCDATIMHTLVSIYLLVSAAARRQKQAASEKEQYKELFRKQLDLHIKARSSYYPCTYQAVLRFNVPNAKVTWDVSKQ